MAPSVEITIPNTTVSSGAKPHTLYNISLRLPLRTYIVQKRYSDFLALDTTLTSLANGAAPPAPLPAKHWFSSTVSNAALTEERRAALQSYLQAVASADDSRWRNTSAWRAFLNLPSSSTLADSASAAHLHSALTTPGQAGNAPLTDPTAWLDVHRDVKAQLRDARQHLARRETAATAQAQHESAADAKKCLVRAGTLIAALEQGLKSMGGEGGKGEKRAGEQERERGWGEKMGEGEVRRRRDLVGAARKEREGLEALLNSMALRSPGRVGNGGAVATAADRDGLFNGVVAASAPGGSRSGTPVSGTSSRRVLGGAPLKETERTRELDNEGVLQLQKQVIREQDAEVLDLGKAVARMKEMGVQIGDEIEVQNSLLKLMDEDVERVDGKIGVAKKRIAKIR